MSSWLSAPLSSTDISGRQDTCMAFGQAHPSPIRLTHSISMPDVNDVAVDDVLGIIVTSWDPNRLSRTLLGQVQARNPGLKCSTLTVTLNTLKAQFIQLNCRLSALEAENSNLKHANKMLRSEVGALDRELTETRASYFGELSQRRQHIVLARQDRETIKILDDKVEQAEKFIMAMVDIRLHGPVLYSAAEALKTGQDAEDALIDAVAEATKKKGTSWSRIIPAVVGSQSSEYYTSAVNCEREEVADYWKTKVNLDAKDTDIFTASDIAYVQEPAVLDDMLALLNGGASPPPRKNRPPPCEERVLTTEKTAFIGIPCVSSGADSDVLVIQEAISSTSYGSSKARISPQVTPKKFLDTKPPSRRPSVASRLVTPPRIKNPRMCSVSLPKVPLDDTKLSTPCKVSSTLSRRPATPITHRFKKSRSRTNNASITSNAERAALRSINLNVNLNGSNTSKPSAKDLRKRRGVIMVENVDIVPQSVAVGNVRQSVTVEEQDKDIGPLPKSVTAEEQDKDIGPLPKSVTVKATETTFNPATAQMEITDPPRFQASVLADYLSSSPCSRVNSCSEGSSEEDNGKDEDQVGVRGAPADNGKATRSGIRNVRKEQDTNETKCNSTPTTATSKSTESVLYKPDISATATSTTRVFNIDDGQLDGQLDIKGNSIPTPDFKLDLSPENIAHNSGLCFSALDSLERICAAFSSSDLGSLEMTCSEEGFEQEEDDSESDYETSHLASAEDLQSALSGSALARIRRALMMKRKVEEQDVGKKAVESESDSDDARERFLSDDEDLESTPVAAVSTSLDACIALPRPPTPTPSRPTAVRCITWSATGRFTSSSVPASASSSSTSSSSAFISTSSSSGSVESPTARNGSKLPMTSGIARRVGRVVNVSPTPAEKKAAPRIYAASVAPMAPGTAAVRASMGNISATVKPESRAAPSLVQPIPVQVKRVSVALLPTTPRVAPSSSRSDSFGFTIALPRLRASPAAVPRTLPAAKASITPPKPVYVMRKSSVSPVAPAKVQNKTGPKTPPTPPVVVEPKVSMGRNLLRRLPNIQMSKPKPAASSPSVASIASSDLAKPQSRPAHTYLTPPATPQTKPRSNTVNTMSPLPPTLSTPSPQSLAAASSATKPISNTVNTYSPVRKSPLSQNVITMDSRIGVQANGGQVLQISPSGSSRMGQPSRPMLSVAPVLPIGTTRPGTAPLRITKKPARGKAASALEAHHTPGSDPRDPNTPTAAFMRGPTGPPSATSSSRRMTNSIAPLIPLNWSPGTSPSAQCRNMFRNSLSMVVR